jgi:hypothetical protein
MAFAPSGFARADEACSRRLLRVGDNEKPVPRRHPENEEALLVRGVCRVRHVERERVGEDGDSLFERDAVLLQIVSGLRVVPLELVAHTTNLPA